MEGLGKKLQDARLERNLTLDEAARMTKIRPSRLQDIENEDFSEFASLAYAKGFLLIYGKFLNVDVSPYLEAFETSESVTVDGYAYLQQEPDPQPRPSRHVSARRPRSSGGGGGGGLGSFLPLVIGVGVLVVGFMVMKWIVEVQRLRPSPRQMVGVGPTSTAVPESVVAPRAVPVDNAPVSTPAPVVAEPTAAPTAPPVPTAAAVQSEPEVRRAEPVHAEDIPKVKPTAPPVVRKPAVRVPVPNTVPRTSPVPRAVPRP
jgi:cytoskeletal protein RodZ